METLKVYHGFRTNTGQHVNVQIRNTNIYDRYERYKLNPRQDLANHSPDGFNWGYNGSGCAQLALALLADCTGNDKLALRYYQQFKEIFIANIGADTWEVPNTYINNFIMNLMEQENEEQNV